MILSALKTDEKMPEEKRRGCIKMVSAMPRS